MQEKVTSNHVELVGIFSASDLKGLKGRFPDVNLSVGEYLQKYSPKSLDPVYTTLTAPLSSVIKEFATKHIWHMFVRIPVPENVPHLGVGEHSKQIDVFPVGILSVTDVLTIIAHFKFHN
jgi:hypothetical protein